MFNTTNPTLKRQRHTINGQKSSQLVICMSAILGVKNNRNCLHKNKLYFQRMTISLFWSDPQHGWTANTYSPFLIAGVSPLLSSPPLPHSHTGYLLQGSMSTPTRLHVILPHLLLIYVKLDWLKTFLVMQNFISEKFSAMRDWYTLCHPLSIVITQ